MKYDADIDFCMETWSDIASARTFPAVIFVLDSLIPLFLMVYLYGRIVFCLWFRSTVPEPTRSALLRARKKITKMILIVTVLYALFWTPVVVLYFIAYYNIPNVGYGSVAYNSSVVFVCLNSFVNPFVCSFQNERFRKGLRDLFRSTCLMKGGVTDPGQPRNLRRNTTDNKRKTWFRIYDTGDPKLKKLEFKTSHLLLSN